MDGRAAFALAGNWASKGIAGVLTVAVLGVPVAVADCRAES